MMQYTTGSRITVINRAYGPDPLTGRVFERVGAPQERFFRFKPDDIRLPICVISDEHVVAAVNTEVTA